MGAGEQAQAWEAWEEGGDSKIAVHQISKLWYVLKHSCLVDNSL